jgi:hypothetical protein
MRTIALSLLLALAACEDTIDTAPTGDTHDAVVAVHEDPGNDGTETDDTGETDTEPIEWLDPEIFHGEFLLVTHPFGGGHVGMTCTCTDDTIDCQSTETGRELIVGLPIDRIEMVQDDLFAFDIRGEYYEIQKI